MESIANWFLQGCDYVAGVELYAQLPGCKPVLLKNLRAKQTATNLEKLKNELSKENPGKPAPDAKPKGQPAKTTIARRIPETTTTTTGQQQKPTPEEDVKRSPLFHQLPAELREVLLEAYELFRKNCLLKTFLNDVPAHEKDKALELQLQIYRNFERNRLCWEKIDYWQEHGRVMQPKPSKFARLTAAGKVKKQQNRFSSISKLSKRLQENESLLQGELSIKQRTRLEKLVSRQKANLFKQRQELATLTNMIDGHE